MAMASFSATGHAAGLLGSEGGVWAGTWYGGNATLQRSIAMSDTCRFKCSQRLLSEHTVFWKHVRGAADLVGGLKM